MQEIEIQTIREKLKHSPVFHFSLGSKELFHSNFLAWLAERYPVNTGVLFADYLKERNGDLSIKNVAREKRNRDLTFIYGNTQELIIENKVKSIPYYDQLQMYSQDARNNQNFLLLSLV